MSPAVIERGVVFLEALHFLGMVGGGDGAERAEGLGAVGELLPATAHPPPVTIVVLRSIQWSLLERSAAWLAMAERVIVVCDQRDEDEPPEGMTEQDLREVMQEERRLLAERLEGRVQFLDVRDSDEGNGEEGEREGETEDALERMIRLALRESGSGSGSATESASATGSESGSGSGSGSGSESASATGSESASGSGSASASASASATPWPVPLRPLLPKRASSALHPWLPWRPPGADQHRDGFDEEDTLRHLSSSLAWPPAGPALLDGATGELLDLQTGARTPLPGLTHAAERWRPIAAHPDGARWLRARPGRPTQWSLDDGAAAGPAQLDGWGTPIGVDPSGALAWTGGRCRFTWRLLTPRGPAFWTPSDHDWPSGHGKKLYGYKDNDPLFVQLSADGTTCLSVYEHDALLTPGVPLRWRTVAPAGAKPFALAERSRGEPRALFFERSDDDDAYPADPYAADEDARDRRAVVTLGPSPALRYAVGLSAPVYRLAGGQVERINTLLGSLAGAAAWAVFDEQHQLVRCGRGRLLCGWDRWLHILEDGQLRREDLISGERAPLGPVDRAITFAHALVGSPHAVLFSSAGSAGGHLRLV